MECDQHIIIDGGAIYDTAPIGSSPRYV